MSEFQGRDPQQIARDERTARTVLNRLRSRLEEWGLVTASVPAVFVAKHQFKIDQNPADFPTIKDYLKMQYESVAGTSMQSTQTGISNQISLGLEGSFGVDPVTGGVIPTQPGADKADISRTSTPDIKFNNLVTPPAAPGALLEKLAKINGIPPRIALLLAMNDKLTERILSQMADPPVEDFTDKESHVYFAIVQVSCNPGWRTRENYIADLTATCEYIFLNSDREVERVQPIDSLGAPRVFSVLPLLDSQNLELGNSDRSVMALAAEVSAAYPTIGLNILGKDLLTFVRSYQKDSVTRNPITVTNSYSNGRNFGFRFAPSFMAQADPSYRKSRAANILNAVSFPVLVTVIVKNSDFKEKGKKAYNNIRVNISTRWLIKDRPPMVAWYRRLYTPMNRETESLRESIAKDVDTLRDLFNLYDNNKEIYAASSKVTDKSDFPLIKTVAYQRLRADALDLITKMEPQVAVIPANETEVPGTPPTTLTIDSPAIQPKRYPGNEPFDMVISGTNLDGVKTVFLGGKPGVITPLGNKKIRVSFRRGEVSTVEGYSTLVVASDSSSDMAVLEAVPEPAPVSTDVKPVTIDITRDDKGNITQIKVDRSQLGGDVSGKDLLDALTRNLSPSSGSPKGTAPAAP